MQEALINHFKTGSTTICRAWMVRRKDGMIFGFTDHDDDLIFDEIVFAARTGMTALALQQTTGMAVDNTEVTGALRDDSLTEEDIIAGRYDGAEVKAYIVNWADVSQRSVIFAGTFGDIVRSDGEFRVELRGLTAALNTQSGRVYHSACGAVLGDEQCKLNLAPETMSIIAPIEKVRNGRNFHFLNVNGFQNGWFDGGQAIIIDGIGNGQIGRIKSDTKQGDFRKIDLWQSFGVEPKENDRIRLVPGCDKLASTCQNKFNNFLNFRGFPHIPGEDWLRANPAMNVKR